jgi:hypothetical protein
MDACERSPAVPGASAWATVITSRDLAPARIDDGALGEKEISPECRAILTVAAVLGYEFSLDLLAAVTNRPRGPLVSALDEAMRSGLVRPALHAAGLYAFADWRVRSLLGETMPGRDLAEIHRTVASALDRRRAVHPHTSAM